MFFVMFSYSVKSMHLEELKLDIDQEFTKSVFGVKLPEPFKQAKTQWSYIWKRFDLIIIGNTQVNQLNHNQHGSCKVQTLLFDLNVETSVFS